VHEECRPLAIMSDETLVTKGAMWLADNLYTGKNLRGFVRMHPWLAGLARAVWNNQSTMEGQLFICGKRTLACKQAVGTAGLAGGITNAEISGCQSA